MATSHAHSASCRPSCATYTRCVARARPRDGPPRPAIAVHSRRIHNPNGSNASLLVQLGLEEEEDEQVEEEDVRFSQYQSLIAASLQLVSRRLASRADHAASATSALSEGGDVAHSATEAGDEAVEVQRGSDVAACDPTGAGEAGTIRNTVDFAETAVEPGYSDMASSGNARSPEDSKAGAARMSLMAVCNAPCQPAN